MKTQLVVRDRVAGGELAAVTVPFAPTPGLVATIAFNVENLQLLQAWHHRGCAFLEVTIATLEDPGDG